MPLPKRPSGGAIPKKVAPPQSGEQESSADVEDFALPELDDFTLPDFSFEPEVPIEKVPSIPQAAKAPTAVADSSRERFNPASSNNQADLKPLQTAVSDRLPVMEDEDEETALNRELGLLDDEDFAQPSVESNSTYEDSIEDDESEEDGDEDVEGLSSDLIELEENLPEASETTEDDEDDFADLLRGLEQTINGTDEEDISEEDSGSSESSGTVNSDSSDLDADWEAALSELEALSIDVDPESQESDSDDEDDEESEEEEEFDLSGFVPPTNPFSSVPVDFDDDDENDDSEDSDLEEDDFVPPSDPFANPFASEKPKSRRSTEPEIEEEIEETSEDEEASDTPRSGSLKDKVASALSPAKAKRGLANYFAKINAELHGEEPPKPRTDEDDEPIIDQDEELNGRPERSPRSRIKIFGFLAPVRALYTGIVNFIFGVLTTVLGILAKLPLIGFVFKIALEATKVLRAIAQYIPLAFFIGGLITVSYLSVPRDSLIVLPDSGGSTFDNFSYDSGSNSTAGTITNTGDIIADVQPIFEVRAIKPGLNPVSWVIPEVVSKCEAKSVRVDIDSTMNVTAKCSEPITGFFPRVTGELK